MTESTEVGTKLVQSDTKERPILFSAPIVRAILAGEKTQTRRIVKPVRGFEHNDILKYGMPCAADPWAVWWHSSVTDRVGCLQECPYGVPGERLWVREAWKQGESRVWYRADGHMDVKGWPWKPGIHMFRHDSRITLEITGIRVERLQEISEADAEAEGITGDDALIGQINNPFRTAFADLWESIHGDGSWAVNPWLWVIEFRRLEGGPA